MANSCSRQWGYSSHEMKCLLILHCEEAEDKYVSNIFDDNKYIKAK